MRTSKALLLALLSSIMLPYLAAAWSGIPLPPQPSKTPPRVKHHHNKAAQRMLLFATAASAHCGVLVLVSAAQTASAATAANVGAGKTVFEAHCAVCHAGGQNKFNLQRTLHKESLEKFIDGGMTSTNIQDFVQNSVLHRGKFVLGNKLSEKDYQNVAAYVVEQASTNKWE